MREDKLVDAFYELCGRENLARCPCCDHLTLPEQGRYDICPICFWEDDGTTDLLAWSPFNPNGITLLEGRTRYLKDGAKAERSQEFVRAPTEAEAAERAAWRSTMKDPS